MIALTGVVVVLSLIAGARAGHWGVSVADVWWLARQHGPAELAVGALGLIVAIGLYVLAGGSRTAAWMWMAVHVVLAAFAAAVAAALTREEVR